MSTWIAERRAYVLACVLALAAVTFVLGRAGKLKQTIV